MCARFQARLDRDAVLLINDNYLKYRVSRPPHREA